MTKGRMPIKLIHDSRIKRIYSPFTIASVGLNGLNIEYTVSWINFLNIILNWL